MSLMPGPEENLLSLWIKKVMYGGGGQYKTTYLTRRYDKAADLSWKTQEDEENPTKMLANHPRKILEDCVYATTGDMTGAAISRDGSLYTWGLNILGECGSRSNLG